MSRSDKERITDKERISELERDVADLTLLLILTIILAFFVGLHTPSKVDWGTVQTRSYS